MCLWNIWTLIEWKTLSKNPSETWTWMNWVAKLLFVHLEVSQYLVVFLHLNPIGESEMLYSAKASSSTSSDIPCFRELFFQGEFWNLVTMWSYFQLFLTFCVVIDNFWKMKAPSLPMQKVTLSLALSKLHCKSPTP